MIGYGYIDIVVDIGIHMDIDTVLDIDVVKV